MASKDAARLGITPGYPRTLPLLPVDAKQGAQSGPTPGAETLARELFTVPTHSDIGQGDLVRIAALLTRGP